MLMTQEPKTNPASVFSSFSALNEREAAIMYDMGWTTNPFFVEPSRDDAFSLLYHAVNDMRQWLNERGLHAGVKAARSGQEDIAIYIAKGGTFTLARDPLGLDAGYYIARSCLNYDFVCLGDVAKVGGVSYVQPTRYYNHTPTGPSLFRAALGAGLKFSNARDSDGRTAGFYVARCNDPELVALYRQAGGTFSPLDREALSKPARKGMFS